MAIPLYVILVCYGIAAIAVTFVAFWTVLLTGKYPRGMFAYVAGYWKYVFRVTAYFPLLMTDDWWLEEGNALDYDIDYPGGQSRLALIFLKLPSFLFGIVRYLIGVAMFILFGNGFVTGWCILFTGKYPKGQFEINRNLMTWAAQTYAWQWLMRDDAKLFGTTAAVKIWVLIGVVGYITLFLISVVAGG